MKPPVYPFSAIVGQNEMKLALLLAAVDWRLGVLLRGEKGSGKTTAARGLAALLPEPAPFINLPIGATEDRLLGGLHLERTLKGDPVLKPGLLSEAHGGVLYVDEINLLPAHLGDALLDTAASGVNVIEREGLSASHAAEFVLLGSMNPEEGLLRPQLLDRFALCVDITSSLDPSERQVVVERRIAFDRDAAQFTNDWSQDQKLLRDQVAAARERLSSILCSSEILGQISVTVCEKGVRSLRADLATMRASVAYAALVADQSVQPHHVATVLPLVLAHRARKGNSSRRRLLLLRSRRWLPPPRHSAGGDGANLRAKTNGNSRDPVYAWPRDHAWDQCFGFRK
jgi:magnesium chelatase subunit D